MGVFRLLLAIAVLCDHAVPIAHLPWVSGQTAVEVFFVISGFYMQLVLSSKYTRAALGRWWAAKFYAARYLRLYPAYIAAVFAAVAFSVVQLAVHRAAPPLAALNDIRLLQASLANAALKTFIVFTNATMLFQDAAMFLVVNGGHASVSTNYRASEIAIHSALAVPQAWSLGIELTFYLIAPVLLRARSRWLAVIAVVALAAKFSVLVMTPRALWDPFLYRVFPFELAYFCLGALACRYRHAVGRAWTAAIPRRYAAGAAYVVAFAIALGNWQELVSSLLFPVAIALVVPFVFAATADFALDRAIGDLSYPFYVFHYVVFDAITAVMRVAGLARPQLIVCVAAAVTVALSRVVVRLEMTWLEPLRARFAAPPVERAPQAVTLAVAP